MNGGDSVFVCIPPQSFGRGLGLAPDGPSARKDGEIKNVKCEPGSLGESIRGQQKRGLLLVVGFVVDPLRDGLQQRFEEELCWTPCAVEHKAHASKVAVVLCGDVDACGGEPVPKMREGVSHERHVDVGKQHVAALAELLENVPVAETHQVMVAVCVEVVCRAIAMCGGRRAAGVACAEHLGKSLARALVLADDNNTVRKERRDGAEAHRPVDCKIERPFVDRREHKIHVVGSNRRRWGRAVETRERPRAPIERRWWRSWRRRVLDVDWSPCPARMRDGPRKHCPEPERAEGDETGSPRVHAARQKCAQQTILIWSWPLRLDHFLQPLLP
eukprot:Amastigsp_a679049_13.p2 type:complete len:330 gc:universal Amastigsp_a679049_13:1077-88(-)